MTISANYPTIRPSLSLDFANTEQLDPRITFSRPTTAAYYDANTTALAEQNLITQSNNFSSSVLYQASLGTATTDPIGGSTAVPLIESSATGNHAANFNSLPNTIANGTYTISAYIKTGTVGRYGSLSVVLAGNGGVWAGITVDPALGVISIPSVYGTSFSNVSATITSSTNSFYRVSLTFTTPSAIGIGANVAISNVYPVTTTNLSGGQSYIGDGTSNIIVWGIQYEQRSSVTAYNATTTAAITNYIPVLLTAPTNQARFDHDPVARTSLGLLIEQQSTNLLTYSSAFSNAAWFNGNTLLTSSINIAPDGTQTATKIIQTASLADHYIRQPSTSATGAYTATVYAKAAEYGYLVIRDDTNGNRASFNLITGATGATTGTPNATITSVGNGWYRCSMQSTLSSSVYGFQIYVSQIDTVFGLTQTGNGYSGIYIWGAQLEALAFPTSYIPTTVSQVTRSVDSASMTGTNFTSWYQQNQGTIYIDTTYSSAALSVNQRLFFINNSSDTYANAVWRTTTAYYWQKTGQSQLTFSYSTSPSTKIALAYSPTSLAGNINGSVTASNSLTSTYSFPNQLVFGLQSDGTSYNGWIKKFAYYPATLTATNLQALTGS